MAIKKVAPGRWLIDFRDSDGKRYRKQIDGSKKYVEQVEAKLKKEREDDILFPERRTLKVSYGELADRYWALHGKELPGRSAKSMWQVMKDKFGAVKMKDLSSSKLQQFYNELSQKYQSSTCNRYFAVLGAVIAFGIKHDLWNGKNPCMAVNKKPEDNTREVFWSQKDLDKLFEHCSQPVQQIILFALHSGMRRKEIFALDWSHVDMELGVVYVLKSKTHRKRIVPMSEHLKALLQQLGPKATGKVFSLQLSAFESAFRRARAKVGLQGKTFHDLRHTFATTFRIHNGSMSNLQGILGHSSARMTNRYAHFSPEYLREVIACMNDKPLARE